MSSSSSSAFVMKMREGWNDKVIPSVRSLSYNIRTYNYSQFLYDPYPFLLVWIVGAILAIILPRHYWNQDKMDYYNSYGYQVEYDNAQRQYEEAQKNNNNNGDDANNNENNYNSIQQYQNCKWYQWACRKKHKEIIDNYNKYQYYYNTYNNNGNNNGNNGNSRDDEAQVTVPKWYRYIGGTFSGDEDREQEAIWGDNRERENDMSMYGNVETGVIEFIYAWVIIMFVCIVLHGCIVLIRNRPTNGIRLSTFMFIQFLFLIILIIGQGVIKTDERDLENNVYGFYGQLSILLLYTCCGFFIFCIILHIALHIRALIIHYYYQKKQKQQQQELVANDKLLIEGDGIETNPYTIHTEKNERQFPIRSLA